MAPVAQLKLKFKRLLSQSRVFCNGNLSWNRGLEVLESVPYFFCKSIINLGLCPWAFLNMRRKLWPKNVWL